MKAIFKTWVFYNPNNNITVKASGYEEPFQNQWAKGTTYSWEEEWSDDEIHGIESIGLFGRSAVIRFVERKFEKWQTID